MSGQEVLAGLDAQEGPVSEKLHFNNTTSENAIKFRQFLI